MNGDESVILVPLEVTQEVSLFCLTIILIIKLDVSRVMMMELVCFKHGYR